MLSTRATATWTKVDDSMQFASRWVRQAKTRLFGINKGVTVSFPLFIQDYWSNDDDGAVYTEVNA